MGKLTYGAMQREVVIDDTLLAHLEVVVLSRLRRNNAFALRWTETVQNSHNVRRTIWVHQNCDLYFEYQTPDQGELDRELLDRLARAADSNAGVNLRMDASGAAWSAAAEVGLEVRAF